MRFVLGFLIGLSTAGAWCWKRRAAGRDQLLLEQRLQQIARETNPEGRNTLEGGGSRGMRQRLGTLR